MTLASQHPSHLFHIVDMSQAEFNRLVEPRQREIQAHCYRMMGTIQDAEDLAQETFMRAWQRRETLRDTAALRAWLYKIATHLCLDALKKRRRRVIPVTYQSESTLATPIPAAVMEPIWLEPYPDRLLFPAPDTPETEYATRESVKMAFIAALHLLPPRQRAILILRDVLEWEAQEVAEFLDCTISAVKSALHRARTTLATQKREDEIAEPPLPQSQLLADYLAAWERADIPRFVHLLKADAIFSMPPLPVWYRGSHTIGGLVAKTIFAGQAEGRWRLVPTAANGQTSFGLYRQDAPGTPYRAYGIQIVTIVANQISEITTFIKADLFSHFQLPTTISPSN